MMYCMRFFLSFSGCLDIDCYPDLFSGEFRPPPATLAMVAGGGGCLCGIIGLPDQALLSTDHKMLEFHVNRQLAEVYLYAGGNSQRRPPYPWWQVVVTS